MYNDYNKFQKGMKNLDIVFAFMENGITIILTIIAGVMIWNLTDLDVKIKIGVVIGCAVIDIINIIWTILKIRKTRKKQQAALNPNNDNE